MTTDIDRQHLAGVLERLGAERDDDALTAAREAHAIITDAGAAWADVLTPAARPAADDDDDGDEDDTLDDDDGDEDDTLDDDTADDDGGVDDVADEPDDAVKPVDKAAQDESSRLLDRLLAQSGDDEEFRLELMGYREDIEAGEFTEQDRQYLRDLHDRLKK